MSNQISRTIVICSGQQGARVYYFRWGYTPFASMPVRQKCYEIKSSRNHDMVMRILAQNMPSSMHVSVKNSVTTTAMHYNAYYQDHTNEIKRRTVHKVFIQKDFINE